MTTIEFTPHLRQHLVDVETLELEAASLKDVRGAIREEHPRLADYIFDEAGRIRKHVAIFVNDELQRDRDPDLIELPEGARVMILQALSGG